MKNLLSYPKFLLVSILSAISFVSCLYLSIVFFLILIFDEIMNGKTNEILKEDFSAFIQKVSDLPERIFAPVENKGINWSEKSF